jgi:uncharacterized protein YkwD
MLRFNCTDKMDLILGILIFVAFTILMAHNKRKKKEETYFPTEKMDIDSYDLELIEAINTYRHSIGLSKLKVADLESTIALKHSHYMYENSKLCHDYAVDRQVSCRALVCKEIVSKGFSSGKSNFNAYMASVKHRESIEYNEAEWIAVGTYKSYNTTLFLKYKNENNK